MLDRDKQRDPSPCFPSRILLEDQQSRKGAATAAPSEAGPFGVLPLHLAILGAPVRGIAVARGHALPGGGSFHALV